MSTQDHNHNHNHNSVSPTEPRESEKPKKPKPRSYRRDGYWFFQLAEDAIFGPFDKVYDTVIGDRKFEERELDQRETTELLLQFA